MTNREKYQEQIDKFIMNHAALINGEFKLCDNNIKCEDCDFGGALSCKRFIKKWLDNEAEE